MNPKVTVPKAWALLRNGDQDALLKLYDEHYLGLSNFGIKLTGDREFSNDCITQLLIELWDKRAQLPEVKNVRSYLLTALKHKIFLEIKSKNTRKAKNHELLTYQVGKELPFEEVLIQLQTNELLRKKLIKAFARLSPRQKQLLRLKFFEDNSYEEISETCNITARTAYNIIYDSLKVLKAEFFKTESSQLH
ncbi:MAG: sigma-70 family RNA polymerase sigma factor [Ginsengibacter sp.]